MGAFGTQGSHMAETPKGNMANDLVFGVCLKIVDYTGNDKLNRENHDKPQEFGALLYYTIIL